MYDGAILLVFIKPYAIDRIVHINKTVISYATGLKGWVLLKAH